MCPHGTGGPHERPHACRASVAREADRALDPLRPAAEEQILDRRRRVLSFAPGSIFAFVRWAANDFGTIVSRIDILRAVPAGAAVRDRSLCAPRRRHPAADRPAGQRSSRCCK